MPYEKNRLILIYRLIYIRLENSNKYFLKKQEMIKTSKNIKLKECNKDLKKS